MSLKIAIVGQGIAGTVMAWRLIEEGHQVTIFDNNHKHSSSMIAAGMWNPIVFRKITKSWRIDELLPVSKALYERIENVLGKSYLIDYSICRFFSSTEDQNNWSVKMDTPGFAQYMNDEPVGQIEEAPVINDYGYGVVKGSGRIKLPEMLADIRTYWTEKGLVRNTNLAFTEISCEKDSVVLKGESFDRLIFCEGHKAIFNPWFEWLPIQPNKGEVITIHAPELDVESLLNKGFFILPLGQNKYRVGATFDVSDQTPEVTEEARLKLIKKLSKVLSCEYEITEQMVGVRPTVSDRRPIIGWHPEQGNIGIFNGMGTKGVTIAPLMANMMLDSLNQTCVIDVEVCVSRFFNRRTAN